MSPLKRKHLESLRKFSVKAGKKAGRLALKVYKKPVKFEKKSDLSPVSLADREAELLIREMIKKEYPNHRIKGEEFPDEGPADAEFVWHIDPIDGTLMFIKQLPYWGCVIGVEYQDRVIAGAVVYPALKTYMSAAESLGCFVKKKRVRVSEISQLDEACILYNAFVPSSHDQKQRMIHVFDKAYDARGFGDCYAHLLLVQGKVDAVLDPRISPYDVSAVQICVKEAGGQFTDWQGKDHIYGPNALSSNQKIHHEILQTLDSSG